MQTPKSSHKGLISGVGVGGGGFESTPSMLVFEITVLFICLQKHSEIILDVAWLNSLKRTPKVLCSECKKLYGTHLHMPSFILQDLQTCISALHYEHQNMLTSQYQKTVAYKTFHAFGVTFDPHARQWDVCCHHLKTTNHLFICALLNQNQMIYLNEIQEQLLSHCGVKASITTLFHTL
jgi:hypothetical protein